MRASRFYSCFTKDVSLSLRDCEELEVALSWDHGRGKLLFWCPPSLKNLTGNWHQIYGLLWECVLPNSPFGPWLIQVIDELVPPDGPCPWEVAPWSRQTGRRVVWDLAHGDICECRNEACGWLGEVSAGREPLTQDGVCEICQPGRKSPSGSERRAFRVRLFLLGWWFLFQLLYRWLWKRDGETCAVATIWPLRGNCSFNYLMSDQ